MRGKDGRETVRASEWGVREGMKKTTTKIYSNNTNEYFVFFVDNTTEPSRIERKVKEEKKRARKFI